MQKVIETVIINIAQAREAGLKKIEMDLTKIKPDITSDEIRHLFRTLREYNYKIERIMNVLRARP